MKITLVAFIILFSDMLSCSAAQQDVHSHHAGRYIRLQPSTPRRTFVHARNDVVKKRKSIGKGSLDTHDEYAGHFLATRLSESSPNGLPRRSMHSRLGPVARKLKSRSPQGGDGDRSQSRQPFVHRQHVQYSGASNEPHPANGSRIFFHNVLHPDPLSAQAQNSRDNENAAISYETNGRPIPWREFWKTKKFHAAIAGSSLFLGAGAVAAEFLQANNSKAQATAQEEANSIARAQGAQGANPTASATTPNATANPPTSGSHPLSN